MANYHRNFIIPETLTKAQLADVTKIMALFLEVDVRENDRYNGHRNTLVQYSFFGKHDVKVHVTEKDGILNIHVMEHYLDVSMNLVTRQITVEITDWQITPVPSHIMVWKKTVAEQDFNPAAILNEYERIHRWVFPTCHEFAHSFGQDDILVEDSDFDMVIDVSNPEFVRIRLTQGWTNTPIRTLFLPLCNMSGDRGWQEFLQAQDWCKKNGIKTYFLEKSEKQ